MVNKWPPSRAPGGNPASLRKVHRALSLREIALKPGISRIEMARRLGLSFMAVSRIVRELEDAGLLLSIDAGSSSETPARGRPAGSLHLRPDGAYVVGMSISAYSQEVVLVDLAGEPVLRRDARFDDISAGPATVAQACTAIRALIDESGVPRDRVVGAAFSVAANVDAEQGTVLPGGYLGWQGFDLRAQAEQSLSMGITVNRVADALLRAESFNGCARHSRAPVLIHCATTLGASFIANGSLASGADFLSGRIGHFPIRATRLVCSCGQSDCLNCSASGWSILHRLGAIDHPAYQPAHIEAYSRLTREIAQGLLPGHESSARHARVMREAGLAMAKALRYVELTLNPDLLVLGGPLAAHEAYYRGIVRGLQSSGAAGADVVLKLTRSQMTLCQAAAQIALLDTVFSTALDLARLAAAPLSESRASRTKSRIHHPD